MQNMTIKKYELVPSLCAPTALLKRLMGLMPR